MITLRENPPEKPDEHQAAQENLEQTLHHIFIRTKALIAYAKGVCHNRPDLEEQVRQIEAQESDYLEELSGTQTKYDPDGLLEEGILEAPYLDQVIRLEETIASLPNVTRQSRVSIAKLIEEGQKLSGAV